MANKAVFDVEIDDTKFKEFARVFQRYQDELKKLPDHWQKVGKEADETESSFNRIVVDAEKQNRNIDETSDHAKDMGIALGGAGLIWTNISKPISQIGTQITSATKSLLRWSTITAAAGGILGGGSLFGLDRLASAVSSNRRAALGLGVSYGQYQSTNLNYNRLVDAGSILGNVSTAKYDVTSPQYTAFISAGISPQAIKREDPSQLTDDLMERLPQIFEGMNTERDRGKIGATARALGLDTIMSLTDIVAFLRSTPDERRNIINRAVRDVSALDVKDDAQRKWQDFTTKLNYAASKIGVTFADKLARVEPGLEHLSDIFVQAIDKLAGSELVKTGIDKLGQGLSEAADFMESDRFQKAVEDLAKWVGEAAQSIWDFVKSFGGDEPAIAGAPMELHPGLTPDHPLPSAPGSHFPKTPSSPLTDTRAPRVGTGTIEDYPNMPGDTRADINRNPGNIMAGAWATAHGATGVAGWDVNHGVAVFPTPQAGFDALEALALQKYNSGLKTAREIIATPGRGWTPGSPYAGANISHDMGIGVDEDLRLDEPERMREFAEAIARQEGAPKLLRAFRAREHSAVSPLITVRQNTGNNPVTSTYLNVDPFVGTATH